MRSTAWPTQERGEALRTSTFDLVLLDWVCRNAMARGAARAARPGDATPVIIVTARTMCRTGSRARFGADDYVVKPFDLDEVAARMRSVLRRARAAPTCIRIAASRSIRSRTRWSATGARGGLGDEFSVLERSCKGRSVLSRAQLEDRLYGWASPSRDAVEVYVHGLRRSSNRCHPNLRGVGYFVRKSNRREVLRADC